MADGEKTTEQVSFFGEIYQEIVNSPLNLVLVAIITFLIYKIFKSRQPPKPSAPSEPALPALRRDFTVAELKAYDGNQPDGRVLVAVNGTVYDVTRGKRFYGPGKPLVWCIGAAPLYFLKTEGDSTIQSLQFCSSLHFTLSLLPIPFIFLMTKHIQVRYNFPYRFRKVFFCST
jgi:Cytochrome b5-like Heme/Steroid binding domain